MNTLIVIGDCMTKKRSKTIWKKSGEEFVSFNDAQAYAKKINGSKSGMFSNKKARLKKNGRGKTRATINGKGVLGKYNKNGTFTVNTYTVQTTKIKVPRRSKR